MNTHPNQIRNILPPDEAALEPTGEFAADLRNFRSAVHQAAERETSQPQPLASAWLIPAKHRYRTTQRRLILAWSSAALLCVGALPLLHNATRVAPAPAVVAQSEAEDTALLEQVDTAVSESVPSSLAPLATLDTWSSTDSADEITTESSLNASEKKNVAQ
jgi:hypothetical protein